MYKIMFVDDEEQNLFLMEKIIDWEGMGFRVCGIALDGLEGIQVFKETQPDVVFVDIRMDEMDGLELIEKLQQEEKKAVYVIVTAYDEFSYAKKAISLGVKDYLLKPVSRKEMIPMVEDIKRGLDQERKKESEDRFISMQYKSNVFADAFETMENGCLKKEPVLTFPKLESVIDGNILRYFEMFSPSEGIGDLMRLTREWKCECRFSGLDSVFMIVLEEEKEALLRSFERLCADSHTKQYILLGGSAFQNAESFIQGYQKDFADRNRHFYTRESCWYYCGDGGSAGKGVYLRNDRECDEQLHKLIYNGSPDEMVGLIREMAQDAGERSVPPDGLVDAMVELLFLIKSQLTKLYQDRAFMILRHQNIWNLHRVRTAAKLVTTMTDLIAEVSEAVKDILDNKGNHSLMGKAADYIWEHFTDPEFSAGETAEAVHLSRNYFLKVFKEEMGVAFWDYVTNLRMEKAKKLLKNTEDTIYTISREAGYESQYHFSRKFKNLYGISPNEFRNL